MGRRSAAHERAPEAAAGVVTRSCAQRTQAAKSLQARPPVSASAEMSADHMSEHCFGMPHSESGSEGLSHEPQHLRGKQDVAAKR